MSDARPRAFARCAGGGGGSDGGTTTTGGAGGSGVGYARYVFSVGSPEIRYSIGGATGGPVS